MARYIEENMSAAINVVRNGMSKKKAATTITKGPPSVLTADEENTLVRWITTCSKKKFPRRRLDLINSLKNYLETQAKYLKDYKAPDNIICLPSTSKAPSAENIIFQDIEIKVSEDNIQEEHISPDDILENKIQNHETFHRSTPKTPPIKSSTENSSPLEDVLFWPKTPERKGKRKPERMPFVISSKNGKQRERHDAAEDQERGERKEQNQEINFQVLHKDLYRTKKLKEIPKRRFSMGQVGNTVEINVPEFDRGKSDSKNILGVFLEVDDENDLYEIGIKGDRLVQKDSRKQFHFCQEDFLLEDQVSDVSVAFVERARKSSIVEFQGSAALIASAVLRDVGIISKEDPSFIVSRPKIRRVLSSSVPSCADGRILSQAPDSGRDNANRRAFSVPSSA
ncbi:hypothetical protein ILUMI_13971 [Ignelater luminosus]|uniref:HTH CENPB-type domain-containing protein n=1 Tax=Ignelater luminosus TaxID=2038154 RepID=A0A8K0GAX1_IGNLU|nr:hypothetical protein ILUMI_13971 [Ignelater luminosus]